jgi:hypothetical protein
MGSCPTEKRYSYLFFEKKTGNISFRGRCLPALVYLILNNEMGLTQLPQKKHAYTVEQCRTVATIIARRLLEDGYLQTSHACWMGEFTSKCIRELRILRRMKHHPFTGRVFELVSLAAGAGLFWLLARAHCENGELQTGVVVGTEQRSDSLLQRATELTDSAKENVKRTGEILLRVNDTLRSMGVPLDEGNEKRVGRAK